jgi:signal transduction histidine kinase
MAIDEIKKISQVIMPPTMGVIGLLDSLNNLIDHHHPKHKMNFITEWNGFDEDNTDDNLKLSIYRIVQEQLNNILVYSEANNAWFSLQQSDGQIELVIKDDGLGFDPEEKVNGVGLQNINTRAEMHDGTMQIESQPGKGCILTVQFPV